MEKGDSDTKVGHCQGKDKPVGRGMKASIFGNKKDYETVSYRSCDWK